MMIVSVYIPANSEVLSWVVFLFLLPCCYTDIPFLVCPALLIDFDFSSVLFLKLWSPVLTGINSWQFPLVWELRSHMLCSATKKRKEIVS